MPARVAHPESIVETDWVADHLGDDNLRLVEVDVDTNAYEQGHIEGAVGWNWTTQLNDTVGRDILSKEQMQRLLGESGIGRNTTVVFYGDNNNWFATYALWQLKMIGHRRAKIMNGGRQKWINEGRPTTTAAPSVQRRIYRGSDPDTSIRATRDYVLDVATSRNNIGLVDVRAPAEYSGELLAPANLPQEGSQRGGHIPGAANIPWATAVNDADGTGAKRNGPWLYSGVTKTNASMHNRRSWWPICAGSRPSRGSTCISRISISPISCKRASSG